MTASAPDDTGAAVPLTVVVVGWLVGQVAAAVAVGTLVAALAGEGEDFTDLALWSLLPVQLAAWVGMLVVPVWWSRSRGGDWLPVADLRLRTGDWWRWLPLGVAVQVALVPLVYLPLLPVLDDDTDLSDAARELTDRVDGPAGVVVLAAIVVVGAPVVEEVFYRGLLQPALVSHLGAPAGVVLASLVFGLVHLQLLQLPALVVFGLVAGVVTHRTGRLAPAVVAHVGFNATALVVLL